jgi:zinc protease
MRLKIFALIALFFLAACAGKTNHPIMPDDDFVLPFSNKTITGSLENGLKYYIRYNDFPSDKIEFRLNVRSGSLNETERELGIAHFVEHMAFNGTKNFKSNDLIKFMEAAGLVFGMDSNAYTSYKNTIYRLTVPSDNETLLKDAFGILRDWADGVTFDPAEIEKEKGVIIEEWRSRNDAGRRVSQKSIEYIYYGSLYPIREPIGLVDIISGADRGLLKGYYDKWYTASNSALIVVGNIEPLKAEEMVKRYFSTMEKKSYPPKADDFVPLKDGVRFGVISDPELVYTTFSINFFEEEGQISTYKHLKKYILESGALNMLNNRVEAAILEKRRELLSFHAAKSYMDGNLSMLRFIVTTRPETIENDLKIALTEIERTKRFGFTEVELKEIIANQKTFWERAASPDYKYQSSKYAWALSDYDTYGGHFTEYSQDKDLIDRIYSETTLADYNSALNTLLKSGSTLLLVTAPERDLGKIALDADKFIKIKAETAAMELEPIVTESFVDKLIESIPQGGEVQTRTAYGNVDGELITYNNGVRLFIKKSAADKGHFSLAAKKAGGLSILNDNDSLYINIVPVAIGASGFDNITRRQLQMLTAGKQAAVNPVASEYMFEFIGGGDSADIETFFQLLYKYFTAAKVDENVFSSIIIAAENSLVNIEKDKLTGFFREAAKAMFNSRYRRNYLLSSDLPSITAELLQKLYRANFADAGNFVFVLSGDLNVDEVAELGRIYLGGLPPSEKKSAAKNRGVALNKQFGIIEGQGDVEKKSTVQIRFDKDIKPLKDGEYIISLARRILQQRIRENIREDKSGAYSVNTSISYNGDPVPLFSGWISFTCDPDRKDELISEIGAILKDFAENGITEEEFATVKAQQSAVYESSKDINTFWANTISYALITDDKLLSVDEYKELIASIPLESVEKAISEFMSDMRLFIAVYNPKG